MKFYINPGRSRNYPTYTRLTDVTKYVLILVAVLSLALVGCGGGGKGSQSSSNRGLGDSCPVGSDFGAIDYTTVWGASTPQLASQVFQLIDSDGNVVRTDAINRNSQDSSQINIEGVTPGVYEFKASLYSQANAVGTIIGVSSQVLDLCGKTAVVKTTGALTPVNVKVAPGSLTMTQQQSKRFVATAYASNGAATFIGNGAITWSVLGGIGTIDQAGVFTSVNAGNGSIRASLSSPSLSGASAVEVKEFVVTRTKWTVFVFLNAANDLYNWSDDNVNQMEEVANNPDVRFVVQWKQSRDLFSSSTFDGVRRYLVKPDNTSALVSELIQSDLVDGMGSPLDMGKPETLKAFLDWGKTYYPADRYALVLWNHGNGWRRGPEEDRGRAFSYDDQTGSSIQIWEIGNALAGHTFDIVAWDTSLMQMVEVAYELSPFTKFVVGSEESPPAEGYPYNTVFAPMRDNPNDTTANLTKGFIDGMVNNPSYSNRKITQSSVDTLKLGALATSLDAFGQALINNANVMSHIDLENEFGDLSWSTSGYSNLANVHDGSSGTSASAATAVDGDHITVTWPSSRYVDRVEILGALGVENDTRIEYTLDGTNWLLLTSGLVDGNAEYSVKATIQGVRVLHNHSGTKAVSVAEIRVYDNAVDRIRKMAKSYSPTSVRYYRDIVHVCQLFEAEPFVPSQVKTASANVRAKVADAVVWEGHNVFSENSFGLSFDFSPADVFASSRTDYIQMQFAISTVWDEWLTIAP